MPNDPTGLGVLAVALLLALPEPASAQAPRGSYPVLLDVESAAACGDEPVNRVAGEDMPPGLYGQTLGRQEGQRIARAAVDFSIDAEAARMTNLAGQAGEQVQATLAGWRFQPRARSGCRLNLRYTPVPVDRASPDLLARFFAVTRTSGAARDVVERRLAGAGAACGDRRRPRVTARPDFLSGPKRPGVQDWTIVRWNVDAAGRATDIETLASSGDAAFDARAREATGLTELEPGPPQTGCVYNWYRQGAPLPAPDVPPPPADPVSNCPAAVLAGFRPNADGRMPAAFSDRGIEGWALVRFDISPWGEIGAVGVIEAQPAAQFGYLAGSLVATARAQPGPGAVRCVQPVLFRLPSEP